MVDAPKNLCDWVYSRQEVDIEGKREIDARLQFEQQQLEISKYE